MKTQQQVEAKLQSLKDLRKTLTGANDHNLRTSFDDAIRWLEWVLSDKP